MKISFENIFRLIRGYIASAINEQGFNIMGASFNSFTETAAASVYTPLEINTDEFNRSKYYRTRSIEWDSENKCFVNTYGSFDYMAIHAEIECSIETTVEENIFFRIRVTDAQGTERFSWFQRKTLPITTISPHNEIMSIDKTFISEYGDRIYIEVASSRTGRTVTWLHGSYRLIYGTRFKNSALPDKVLYKEEEGD